MNRIEARDLDALSAEARQHARRRMNRNLHRMEEPIHRLLNAMEPDSYVAPHRHLAAPRGETLLLLRGRGAVLLFDDAGGVREKIVLSPAGPTHVVELPPDAWHTLLALEPGTVWFEVKQGPYVPPAATDVAAWAPPTSDHAAVSACLAQWRRLVS